MLFFIFVMWIYIKQMYAKKKQLVCVCYLCPLCISLHLSPSQSIRTTGLLPLAGGSRANAGRSPPIGPRLLSLKSNDVHDWLRRSEPSSGLVDAGFPPAWRRWRRASGADAVTMGVIRISIIWDRVRVKVQRRRIPSTRRRGSRGERRLGPGGEEAPAAARRGWVFPGLESLSCPGASG